MGAGGLAGGVTSASACCNKARNPAIKSTIIASVCVAKRPFRNDCLGQVYPAVRRVVLAIHRLAHAPQSLQQRPIPALRTHAGHFHTFPPETSNDGPKAGIQVAHVRLFVRLVGERCPGPPRRHLVPQVRAVHHANIGDAMPRDYGIGVGPLSDLDPSSGVVVVLVKHHPSPVALLTSVERGRNSGRTSIGSNGEPSGDPSQSLSSGTY